MTGSGSVRVWSATEATELLGAPTVDLDLGALRDVPVLVIDNADRLTTGTAAVLDGLPLVSVGIAPVGTAPAVDVLVAVADAAAAVVDGVMANPMAAVTCCQVLRHGSGMSIDGGLLLESTAFGTLQGGPE
ncbi:MAG: hypothetical protein HOJ86_08760, partial [Acidimicrobiaceae bacterium]|nr:hypothetical protein [Acidimicrobiaceae bacterium]